MAFTQPQKEQIMDAAARGPLFNKKAVGRHSIDGAVIVYDLDDPPAWVTAVESSTDEDGNTPPGSEWSYGQNSVGV